MKHHLTLAALTFCGAALVAPLASAQTTVPGVVYMFKRFSVVIDAGHGGKDVGDGEKDFNLAVALKLRAELEKQGVQVVMTRTKDEFLSLHDRVDLASSFKTDCFISIHGMSGRKIPSSYVVNYSQPESKTLADVIGNSLMKKLKPEVVGKVAQTRYFVLRQPSIPAIMVTGSLELLSTPEAQQDFAAAVAEGLLKIRPVTVAPKSKILPRFKASPKQEDKESPMIHKPNGVYRYLGN